MKDSEILARVDHTFLSATATSRDIENLCNEAIKFKTASVCIPPTYVAGVKNSYPNLNICTVVGFPLGYDVLPTKAVAAQTAIKEGASEIDVVVNIPDVKNGNFDTIRTEITVLKHIIGEKILKVIIETCYLTESEKISMCRVVSESGADYIKTSTGFGSGGATIEDIKLLRDNISPNVKIKASGGIKTREDMILYIKAGCDRLGTSSAVKILTTGISKGY